MKVCLLTDHHLCINPRLWKEAFLYKKLGFEVVIISMWQSADFLEKDFALIKDSGIVYKNFLDMIPGHISSATRYFFRIRKRIACELQKRFGIGSGWAISYAPELMYKSALKERADLYVAHLECAFFIGKKLIESGMKVAFDFEDWYSNDYLVPERPVKLLKRIEKFAIKKGAFITAASDSMAKAIENEFLLSRKITTIYNGFSLDEFNRSGCDIVPRNDDEMKIIWFSRTVGPNRGIEKFIDALAYCKTKCSIHFLGKLDFNYDCFLKDYMPKYTGHQIYFHDFIEHKQIPDFLANFDLGLALDININANRNLTVTNKILQYLQVGLPVLCSNTNGHLEVYKQFPDLVFPVNLDFPEVVAEQLDAIYLNRPIYNEYQANAFAELFSWEAQERKFEMIIHKIF